MYLRIEVQCSDLVLVVLVVGLGPLVSGRREEQAGGIYAGLAAAAAAAVGNPEIV